MTLPTLKHGARLLPSRVRMLNVENVKPRPAGRRWQAKRQQIQVEQGSRCQGCGRLWMPELDQVDHRVPREQGGSDADENLQLLCDDCHEAKTRAEAQSRARTCK